MKQLCRLKTKRITTPDAWDRYVIGHDASGYCHLFNWSRVISDAYHHHPVYLAAVRDSPQNKEAICGILPLFRFRSVAGRSRLVSIPFFDAAGILAKDRETATFLFRHSASFSMGSTVSGMELRQDRPLNIPDMAMKGTLPEVYHAKVGLHIPLSGSQKNMMTSFKSKLRSQIHKGIKNGLTWKIGKKELLPSFYKVFSQNMRDLGSPVHSKKFFNAIFTHFYHHAFICVVFHRSTPVAASVMIRFKKKLANPWASSVREFRHLNTNMFLYWQMIRFACNLGMETFDMGRSSKGASTYRFKKQWGPEETQLSWYHWDLTANTPARTGETLTLKHWKNLPMPVANFWGPFVRRHISL
jgi:FemAB-related protein (PEP-CTERM system-associated)